MATPKPGKISFKVINNTPQLDDLWFMVGSRCNLSCAHCYVASSPTNDSLQQITLKEITPFVTEAATFGLKNIYFTGGEPFINKEIMAMLEFCLTRADTTVLTNATFPLTRFIEDLKTLNEKSPFQLRFRVSLDHFEKDKHESIRGKGNFDRTVNNVISLHNAGFTPIITSTPVVYEDGNTEQSAQEGFVQLFKSHGVPVDVKLIPELEMGTNTTRKPISKHVFISEDCMKKPHISPEQFQCHNGRTIEKINGQMIVYPCPIIYNNKMFELGQTLKESFVDVPLTHKACFDFCYQSGGKCTN